MQMADDGMFYQARVGAHHYAALKRLSVLPVSETLRLLILAVALALEPLDSSEEDQANSDVSKAFLPYREAMARTQRERDRLNADRKNERIRKAWRTAQAEELRLRTRWEDHRKRRDAVVAGIGSGDKGVRNLAVQLDHHHADLVRRLESHYQLTLRQIIYRSLRTPAVMEVFRQVYHMPGDELRSLLVGAHDIWTDPSAWAKPA